MLNTRKAQPHQASVGQTLPHPIQYSTHHTGYEALAIPFHVTRNELLDDLSSGE